jgi:hypothetical protein
MNDDESLNETAEVFDRVETHEEGGMKPTGSGGWLRPLFLFGLPGLALSATLVLFSGHWGSEFKSRVTPDIASQPPSGEAIASPLSPGDVEILKERVTNTIRRDVIEKLQATNILNVSVDSLEANRDGSMDLEITASYTQEGPDRKPASRAVTSKLKLEKKGPEWHVTSISPQDSTLMIEDEELIQTARKAAHE